MKERCMFVKDKEYKELKKRYYLGWGFVGLLESMIFFILAYSVFKGFLFVSGFTFCLALGFFADSLKEGD